MDALKAVLKAHGARYPKLQIQEAVKLIYQNEFGGGHLIRDRERFFSMLYREYDSLTFDQGKPLTESIGNGLVRVNLCRLRREQLEPLGERFIAFSVRHQGILPPVSGKVGDLAGADRRRGLCLRQGRIGGVSGSLRKGRLSHGLPQ